MRRLEHAIRLVIIASQKSLHSSDDMRTEVEKVCYVKSGSNLLILARVPITPTYGLRLMHSLCAQTSRHALHRRPFNRCARKTLPGRAPDNGRWRCYLTASLDVNYCQQQCCSLVFVDVKFDTIINDSCLQLLCTVLFESH